MNLARTITFILCGAVALYMIYKATNLIWEGRETFQPPLYYHSPPTSLFPPSQVETQILEQECHLRRVSSIPVEPMKPTLLMIDNYVTSDVVHAQRIPRWYDHLITSSFLVGEDHIASKQQIAKWMHAYYGAGASCHRWIPETWDTAQFWESQVSSFEPHTLFLAKGERQQQKGLKLFRGSGFHLLRNQMKEYPIIQRVITDPLCVNRHKVTIRVYVALILDQCRPLQVYRYFDGFNYFTSNPHDTQNPNDVDAVVTSGYVDRQFYNHFPLTHLQLRGQIPDVIFNTMQQSIDQVLLKVFSAIDKADVLQRPYGRSFQLFGVDLQPLSTGQCLFLEANKGCDLVPKDQADAALKYHMQAGFWRMGLGRGTSHDRKHWMQIK